MTEPTKEPGGCGKPGHVINELRPGVDPNYATRYCQTCADEAQDPLVLTGINFSPVVQEDVELEDNT